MNPFEYLILLIGFFLSIIFIQIVLKIQSRISGQESISTYQILDQNFRWVFLFILAILLQSFINSISSEQKFSYLIIESLPNVILNYLLFFIFSHIYLSHRNLWFLFFVYCVFLFVNNFLVNKIFQLDTESNWNEISLLNLYIGIATSLLVGSIFSPKSSLVLELTETPTFTLSEILVFLLGILCFSFVSFNLLNESLVDFFELLFLSFWSGILSCLIFLMIAYLWGKSMGKEIGILGSFSAGFFAGQFQSIAVNGSALFLLSAITGILSSFLFFYLRFKKYNPIWIIIFVFTVFVGLSYLVQPWIELKSISNFDALVPFSQRAYTLFHIIFIYSILIWSLVGFGKLIDKIRR